MKKQIAIALAAVALLSPLTSLAQGKGVDPIGSRIEAISKPYVEALQKARTSDSKLDLALRKFESKGRAIIEDKAKTSEEKAKAMKTLALKADPVMRAWFSAAKINEKKYQLEVDQSMIKYMAKSGTQYSLTYKGYLSWFWRQKGKDLTPPPEDKEITLAPPFEFIERRIRGDGEVVIRVEEGFYSTEAERFGVGGHDNVGGLGHFLPIEENFQTVRVTAALPETSWFVSAWSDLVGAAGSSSRSQIQVLADGNIECERNYEHAGVIAPVLWFVAEFGADNVTINCEFPAPAVGDEIVLRFNATAGAWAGGLASGTAKVRATPRDLRIRLQR